MEKSLFDRLGGIYPIALAVDKFSDALINNPVVGKDSPNPQLREWNRKSLDRLPGLKWMRTLWVASVAMGDITPPDLKEPHKKFKITSEEFDEVASILEDTLTELKIPAKEKAEVMGAFTGHKSHVVTKSEKSA